MNDQTVLGQSAFRIGAILVQPSLNRLECRGYSASLEPRIMDLLCTLARSPSQVMLRAQLIDEVWGVSFGGDESLSRAISLLRKTIKTFGEAETYIETIARRGYRLVQPVESEEPSMPLGGSASRVVQPALEFPDIPSIAVLPFENQSDQEGYDYFIDGLMEEVVTALTRIRTLFVIASGSTLSLRGEGLSPVEAARKLGVRYVVEGRARRAGERIRIWAKLIDATDGGQVWQDKFDGSLGDVFDLYDSVAQGVAGVIEFSVQTRETFRANKRPTSDLRAYELYLRGLARLRSYTREGMYDALELLQKALEHDAHYPLAHSLLASCHANIAQSNWSDDPLENAKRIADHIEVSLVHGPDDPQVVATASLACRIGGDLATAHRLAEQAYALNTGSSFTAMVLGAARISSCEFEQAEQLLNQSMRLDPFSPNRTLQVGYMAAARFAQRHFSEAAILASEAVKFGQSPPIYGLLASAWGHTGDRERGQMILDQLEERAPIEMEAAAGTFFSEPEYLDLFHEGIAMVRQR